MAICPAKIELIGGLGGVPEYFFFMESYYFYYLGAHTKFQSPMICPSRLDLKFTHLSGQNRVKKGGRGGGPRITFFYWNPNHFVTWEPMQNFRTLAVLFLVEK